MEIVSHRQKILDAMESNAKVNDNSATKVMNREDI